MPEDTVPSPIRLGTCAWSFDDWKGNFYPEKIAPAAMLPFYARYFSAVEIDSTFYATPAASAVEAWSARTPPHFRFTAKMPKAITHEKRLRACERETDLFLQSLRPLGEKLGAVLLQFSEWFEPGGGNAAALQTWLEQHGRRGVRLALELRHPAWRSPEMLELLRAHGVALAWNDLSRLEDAASEPARHPEPTVPFVYARLMGDQKTKFRPDGGRVHRYGSLMWPRSAALRAWAERLRLAGLAGAEVYVFVNNHYEGSSPLTCERLARELGVRLELPPPPPPPPEQMSLFG